MISENKYPVYCYVPQICTSNIESITYGEKTFKIGDKFSKTGYHEIAVGDLTSQEIFSTKLTVNFFEKLLYSYPNNKCCTHK